MNNKTRKKLAGYGISEADLREAERRGYDLGTIVRKMGEWDLKADRHIYERIYVDGYKWTPFCWKTKRGQWSRCAPWTSHWKGWRN